MQDLITLREKDLLLLIKQARLLTISELASRIGKKLLEAADLNEFSTMFMDEVNKYEAEINLSFTDREQEIAP